MVIFGYPGCGKTYLAKYLNKEHKRALVNMNEIFEWNRANKTEAYVKAQAFLDARKAEVDRINAEKEKLTKKLKKGANLEEKWNQDPAVF